MAVHFDVAVNTLMPYGPFALPKFACYNSVTNLATEINWWVLPVHVDMWITFLFYVLTLTRDYQPA